MSASLGMGQKPRKPWAAQDLGVSGEEAGARPYTRAGALTTYSWAGALGAPWRTGQLPSLFCEGSPFPGLTPHFCSMPRPFFLTLSYAPRLCEDLLARFHSLCVLNCPRLFWHADRIAVPSDLGGCRRLPPASASVPGCWASIGTPGPSP